MIAGALGRATERHCGGSGSGCMLAWANLS
jgi:hypothetical protein